MTTGAINQTTLDSLQAVWQYGFKSCWLAQFSGLGKGWQMWSRYGYGYHPRAAYFAGPPRYYRGGSGVFFSVGF